MSFIIHQDKNLVKITKKSSVFNQNLPPVRVLFFGTPEFGIPSLNRLIRSEYYDIVAVVCGPDKPVGREQKITPPPVKVEAQKHKILILQPENIKDPEFFKKIEQLKPDLIITAAYRKILPKEILDIPRWGALNIHPSLLPKYRGPSPIQYAILNGDKETGISIMLMTEKMDEGPILSQKAIQIEKNETAETLHEKLSLLGSEVLMWTLERWITLKLMPEEISGFFYPQEQDHSKATYTKIITKEDGKIIWDNSAEEIERKTRAFNPWPSAYSTIIIKDQELRLKIFKTKVIKENTEKELGEVFLTKNDEFAVQTGNNCLIVEELQPAGKNKMSAKEFLNGYPEIIGMILK